MQDEIMAPLLTQTVLSLVFGSHETIHTTDKDMVEYETRRQFPRGSSFVHGLRHVFQGTRISRMSTVGILKLETRLSSDDSVALSVTGSLH